MRIVVACFGNPLRADDGFGFVVAQRLSDRPVPAGVTVLDVGIGGIHLVQELLEPADALVLVDALDLGRSPGSVVVLRPDVRDVSVLPVQQQRDELADMHYATPERALLLARGLGVLPETTIMVGAQALDADGLGEGLSTQVAGAVDAAVEEVRRVVSDLGIPWEQGTGRAGPTSAGA